MINAPAFASRPRAVESASSSSASAFPVFSSLPKRPCVPSSSYRCLNSRFPRPSSSLSSAIATSLAPPARVTDVPSPLLSLSAPAPTLTPRRTSVSINLASAPLLRGLCPRRSILPRALSPSEGGASTPPSPSSCPSSSSPPSSTSRASSARSDADALPAEVICVGEALFDLISAQPGMPRERVTRWVPHAGGAPCNVSTAIARLGVRTSFVSALGDDEMGRKLINIMTERGVRTHACRHLPSAPTRDIFVTISDSGDRCFSGFGGRTDSYADCFIREDAVPWDELKSAKVVVMGTLGLAYPETARTMRRVIKEVRSVGSHSSPAAAASSTSSRPGPDDSSRRPMILVDVNWRDVFWAERVPEARGIILDFLKDADIIKLSDADLVALLNADPEAVLKHPEMLSSEFPKARCILVTAGPDGSSFFVRATTRSNAQGNGEPKDSPRDVLTVSGYLPAFKVTAVDTTGAGDAFTAAFTFKLIQSGSIENMVRALLQSGSLNLSLPASVWLPADSSSPDADSHTAHTCPEILEPLSPSEASARLRPVTSPDGTSSTVETHRHIYLLTDSATKPPQVFVKTETARRTSRSFTAKASPTRPLPLSSDKKKEEGKGSEGDVSSSSSSSSSSGVTTSGFGFRPDEVPSIWDALMLAAAAGASACSRPGAMESQPTLEEVQDLAVRIAASQSAE